MDMERTPQEITSLVGREVYSNNGVYVGEVEDVRLDIDAQMVNGLALADLNEAVFEDMTIEGRGVMLPYRWVRAVGDVVIVNDLVERLASQESDESAEVAVA